MRTSDPVAAAAFVRCAPDPIIGLTPEGVITEWNPAAERMYGYDEAQALGRPIDLLAAPGRPAAGLLTMLAAGDSVGRYDTQRVTKDGRWIDVSISISPIADEHGAIVGAVELTRAIGARVAANEQLRRNEMLLAEAQDLAAIGSWEWDVVADEVSWSAGLFRILGLDPDSVTPTYEGYVDRIHPDDREIAEAQIAAVLATGGVVLREIRMLGADGIERITQSRARATRDEHGKVVLVRGTTQDVSELVLATHRLDLASRRNQALLDSAGDGIYGIDGDGITIFANPVAARLTGREVGDILGRSRHDTFRQTRSDGTPHPAGECPVSASLQDGTVHRGDADLYWRRDGTSFPVEYTSTPMLEDGRAVGAVVVFKDISERRALEHSRDDFVASVSHELRTPLTSIRGYLELIGDDAHELSDEQRRFLGVVSRNADRLLRVVDDLLLVAQFDAGAVDLALALVDVGTLVADAVDVARPQAEAAGLVLVADVAATPALRGDRARLGQILDNLMSNAVKFTPAGGQVALRAFADGERVMLEVSDTGTGMSAEEQAGLFQRFYRAPTASAGAIQGTGLGLTIVKALVEAHGGAIAVTSATGAGTTFRVELPAT